MLVYSQTGVVTVPSGIPTLEYIAVLLRQGNRGRRRKRKEGKGSRKKEEEEDEGRRRSKRKKEEEEAVVKEEMYRRGQWQACMQRQ